MRKQIRVDWYRTGQLEQHNSITAPCNIELNKTKAAKRETTEKDRDQAMLRRFSSYDSGTSQYVILIINFTTNFQLKQFSLFFRVDKLFLRTSGTLFEIQLDKL